MPVGAVRYSPTLVEHFLNPRNAGLMRSPTGRRGGVRRLRRPRALSCACGRAVAKRASRPTAAAHHRRRQRGQRARRRTGRGAAELKPQEVEHALDGLPDDRKHAADVVAGACARRRSTARGRRGDDVRRDPSDIRTSGARPGARSRWRSALLPRRPRAGLPPPGQPALAARAGSAPPASCRTSRASSPGSRSTRRPGSDAACSSTTAWGS